MDDTPLSIRSYRSYKTQKQSLIKFHPMKKKNIIYSDDEEDDEEEDNDIILLTSSDDEIQNTSTMKSEQKVPFQEMIDIFLNNISSDIQVSVIEKNNNIINNISKQISKYKTNNINRYLITLENLNTIISKYHECLNDGIINGYISILLQKNVSTNYCRLDSLTYNNIVLKNFKQRKTKTSEQDIVKRLSSINDGYDGIIIPIIENNDHWTLIFVDILKGEIHYYNSMYVSHTKANDHLIIASRMTKFLNKHNMLKKTDVLKANDMSFIFVNHAKTVPQQMDATNCGVYVIFFVQCILEKRNITKTMNISINDIRQKIFDDIFLDIMNF